MEKILLLWSFDELLIYSWYQLYLNEIRALKKLLKNVDTPHRNKLRKLLSRKVFKIPKI